MIIKVLGTRGEIDASRQYHKQHSGILLDNKILIDCGEEHFLAYKPQVILISHLHPDHAFFARTEYPAINIPMYAPELYKSMPITVPIACEPFFIDDYKITPIPVIHSIKVKSLAYLIEHDNKRILYTGDIIAIEKRYRSLFQHLDLVITEASHMRMGGVIRQDKTTGKIFGHTGIPNLIKVFKQYSSTIMLVHFGSWFYEDIKKARQEFEHLAHEHNITIIVGYDGLEITI